MGFAAGGIVSTTRDLSRFLDVLLRGTFLPPAQHKTMWDTVSTEDAQWLEHTDGRHTVVINLNGDRNQPFNTVNAVLAAEFCPKQK
jgi:hypothetical protein